MVVMVVVVAMMVIVLMLLLLLSNMVVVIMVMKIFLSQFFCCFVCRPCMLLQRQDSLSVRPLNSPSLEQLSQCPHVPLGY